MTDTKERAAEKAARLARRAVRAVAEANAADEEREERSPVGTQVSDIRSFVASLPKDVEIKLYRKQDGKHAYCETFNDASEISEDRIREKWGGGTFRIMTRKPDEKGRLTFFEGGSVFFNIASLPVGTPNAPSSTKVEDTLAGQYQAMLMGQMQMQQQMMLQSQESHRAMLALMLQRPPDQSSELMKVLLPLLLTRADPMDIAVKIAELVKPAGPTAGIVEQLTALEKLLELAKGSSNGDGPAWLEAIKSVAPVIQSAMAQRPAAPAVAPGPPTPRKIAPAPVPNVPVVSEPTPVENKPTEPPDNLNHTTTPEGELLGMLDAAMPFLVRAAAKGLDPDEQAAWLLDFVDDGPQTDALGDLLDDPNVLTMLAGRYQAIEPYREWFGRLVKAVASSIEDEDEPAVEEQPKLTVEKGGGT